MHLWVQEVRTKVYVQNMISHNALRNKTTEEMLTDERSKVFHLKIFGYHVYLHVPKEKISKLDLSGEKGTFVGHSVQ